jgi:hypothetical protein
MRRLVALAALLLASTLPLTAQDTFHNCGLQGDARQKAAKVLNGDKNRSTPPTDADIDTAVTIAKMVMIGDDRDRFDEEKGAEIVGYVFDVKPGGVETCNCHATDLEFRDTHIELVPAVNLNDKTHRVIIEITPRMRAQALADGKGDWSTDKLKTTIKHKWIKVRGWLLFDLEHVHNAQHTADPAAKDIWRATCWEIHPITTLEVVPAPHP